MKKFLKWVIRIWPWPLTLNERYDRQTKAIIKKICNRDSVCIDIGCFKGDILEQMIRHAHDANQIAFEPIPEKFELLKSRFGSHATIHPFALGNENKSTTFNYVISNPTYSGLKERAYKGEETIEKIPVEVRRLDDVVSFEKPIRLIKIDVEGGEYDVLKGAVNILSKWKPYIIFEHGVGGADKYDVTPLDVYDFLSNELGYNLCLMEDFLKGRKASAFSREEFKKQFYQKINCYFLAIPRNTGL